MASSAKSTSWKSYVPNHTTLFFFIFQISTHVSDSAMIATSMDVKRTIPSSGAYHLINLRASEHPSVVMDNDDSLT